MTLIRWTVVALLAVSGLTHPLHAATPPPNIVLIFCDDLAYSDLGCYGNTKAKTPNLDRMARQGIRFTDFYVGQPVCSASRAALMTGCYPNRVGIEGALSPKSKTALNTNEITIAKLLKSRGYATAIYGKWHLGHTAEYLPTRQGFDEYFGLPYSNDMWPSHPTQGTNFPPLPLFEAERIVQYMPDQTQLTTWYTEHAVSFIEKNKTRPFFLYVPHNMPHVPLHVSSKHEGKSGPGLYGDVIMEIDWSVGEIMAALRRNGLIENTFVLFSSDNGPWLEYGDHAGSALPLREGKMTSFEGGLREPFLAFWPGHVPAGQVSHELVTAMDLFPTIASLSGAALPTDRIIDGKNIWPLLAGEPGARSPHEAFFYYWGRQLEAVRSGNWKLHFGHEYIHPDPPGHDGKPGRMTNQWVGLELFDLAADPGETNNLSRQFPEVVNRLQLLAEKCRDDLGDSATRRIGKNVRPAGMVHDANETREALELVPKGQSGPNPNPNAEVVKQHGDGTVFLHARQAFIHGSMIQYEPQTNKNTVGYWVKLDDWVSWEFTIDRPGTFAVEILQGCGNGSGRSQVEFSVGDQKLEFLVKETGGFQDFVSREIGTFKFDEPGRFTLQVRPKTKPALAVMDLRSVTLRPVK